MNEQPEPAVGQVWRDLSRGSERLVLVTSIGETVVKVITVRRTPRGFVAERGARNTTTTLHRFNGRGSGYEYVEMAP